MIKLLGLFALALLLSTGWSNAAPTNQTQVAQVEQRPSCFNRCAAKQICPRCNGGGRLLFKVLRQSVRKCSRRVNHIGMALVSYATD
jgi:hypothetical protein